jgi:hypothetical protein
MAMMIVLMLAIFGDVSTIVVWAVWKKTLPIRMMWIQL